MFPFPTTSCCTNPTQSWCPSPKPPNLDPKFPSQADRQEELDPPLPGHGESSVVRLCQLLAQPPARREKLQTNPTTQQKSVCSSSQEEPLCVRTRLAGKHDALSIAAFLISAWGSGQSFSNKISNEECAIPTGMAYGNDKQKQNNSRFGVWI